LTNVLTVLILLLEGETEMARRMRARYRGYCRECREAIAVGDEMVHAGRRENYHAACYEDANEARGEVEAEWRDAARREDAERRANDAEYAAGVADYERDKFNREVFGEEYAAAEEFAWALKTGEGM